MFGDTRRREEESGETQSISNTFVVQIKDVYFYGRGWGGIRVGMLGKWNKNKNHFESKKIPQKINNLILHTKYRHRYKEKFKMLIVNGKIIDFYMAL